MNKQTLAEFQEHLKKSRRIVALVGAGLSVSSGLPTFRGAEGLWKNFNMIDLATPDAFYIDPGLVWQFYSWRRYSALAAKPNRGHLALAKLSNLPQTNFITITQNVDGLSARSGHNSDNLYEIHGSLFTLKCTSFMCNYIEYNNFKAPLTPALRGTEHEFLKSSLDSESPEFSPVKQMKDSELPQCPVCKSSGTQSILRPGVVWFGESLPMQELNEIDDFLESEEGPVDLILVIGTSGTVYPANSYVDRVRLQGGKVAIFNTDIDESEIEGKDGVWGFKGDAAELLPVVLEPLIGEVKQP
ncbi:putative NAD-dependent protein deacylase [[Candida] railenensis]|uniref:NAD-dependent protein deacylase n=1 Tax=[Candida] railenensis TaxID=45579 RepID=A0A9P0QL10_9ASCO|nr:putative NAD-dependent protein deacylase [[Candida] railenensis]